MALRISIGPKTETPAGALGRFSVGLLLSASVLALWLPQGARAALHIRKIPEQPRKNQNLLLSVQGVPSTFQDFIWYLGEEADGGTRLFTYIPELQRPQRDGSAMGQRDIVGFPNGSMLLRHAQPSDSGTFQVAITVNPSWTMRAKTQVRVAEKQEDLASTAAHLPMNPGIMAAAIAGPLAAGALLISGLVCLLVLRGYRDQSPRVTTTGKPELSPHPDTAPRRAPAAAARAGESPLPGPAAPRPCPLLPAGAHVLLRAQGAGPSWVGGAHCRKDPAGQGRQDPVR
ncbi:PREDICTED: carcinoembryonic antigen-related cell adhesion molecule 19 isoform X1 [Chinchilla lanigera]|uniref:carcinoembryonic antigen-related cell adhesion molecule 19 isoform X1 n=1 Tax=Chinchilla lanigera TaxID=34839 RepID=UPI000697A805|nr:PREDICTED: carcinoembryonic antigen-related cell adhesion molecule 19 isoform X1 [Chinchilla lanigera]